MAPTQSRDFTEVKNDEKYTACVRWLTLAGSVLVLVHGSSYLKKNSCQARITMLLCYVGTGITTMPVTTITEVDTIPGKQNMSIITYQNIALYIRIYFSRSWVFFSLLPKS